MRDLTRDQKAQRALAGAVKSERERIIRQYDLTPAEVSRAGTMTPGDAVSNYVGRLDIQAPMLVEDRTPAEKPSKIQRFVEFIGKGFAPAAYFTPIGNAATQGSGVKRPHPGQ